MPQVQPPSLQTYDELRFVRKLGLRGMIQTAHLPRATLLKLYLEGCKKRAKWDGIDGEHVMQFVTGEIAKAATN